jgi:hypothetical protein
LGRTNSDVDFPRRIDLINAQLVTSFTDDIDVIISDQVAPQQMQTTTLWIALLRGAYVVQPSFLINGAGPVAKYHAAVTFWRRVYISEHFKQNHPQKASVVQAAASSPGSKWEVLETPAAFTQAHARAVRQRKGGQVVVLATRGECQNFPGVPRGSKVLDVEAFQKSVFRPDQSRTWSGR